jgi:hypothetical protein
MWKKDGPVEVEVIGSSNGRKKTWDGWYNLTPSRTETFHKLAGIWATETDARRVLSGLSASICILADSVKYGDGSDLALTAATSLKLFSVSVIPR